MAAGGLAGGEGSHDFVNGRLRGGHFLIHGHCHHKAVFGGPKNEIALLRQAGATVEAIEAGCCGMAGPFGFEADKFEGHPKPSPARACSLRLHPPGQRRLWWPTASVAASRLCNSGHTRALHFAEVLARSCGCGA